MFRLLVLVFAVFLAGAWSTDHLLARQTPPVATHIVIYHDGVDPGAATSDLVRGLGLQTESIYRYALNGAAVVVPPGKLNALKHDPRVKLVEPNQVVRIAGQEIPTGIQRIFAPGNGNIGIDGSDDVRVDVDVAVIDTGIDLDHPDLNVVASTNCSGGGPFRQSCGSGGDDDNSHGTHVAGTIGALDNGIGVVGVAPGARLWAVKVLRSDGSGYISWIIAGIDYVTANAADIEVANMSLGCECSSAAMDTAITKSVAAGVVYAVAAGNSDKDAATFSPANHPDVITVSALADFDGAPGGSIGIVTNTDTYCRTDEDDTLANFSNWGNKVEIAAPGVCILSTVPGGYATYSGTSMASPHVAGAAALYRATAANQDKSPAGVKSALQAAGNYGWDNSDDGDTIKERLLDVSNETVFNPVLVAGSGGGSTPPPNSPPTASFTFACDGLTCDFNGSGSSDSDGTIASYAWNFGDTGTGTGATVSHTYASGGTYTVTLTVIDDDSASGQESQSVTVSAPSAGGFTLSATGYKVKGVQKADLTWSGAASTNVDVFRGGIVIAATTPNDGAYTDEINAKGGGSYTYKVCEAGTATCSNEVTIVF